MRCTYTTTASINVENILIKVGDQVKSQWYKFGLVIGAPRDFLDQLSGEDEQCLTQVLEYWLKQHAHQPTWQEVINAQQKIKSKPELSSNEGTAKRYVIVVLYGFLVCMGTTHAIHTRKP